MYGTKYLVSASSARNSSLEYSDAELNDRILNEAKLWLDGGSMFGEEGENFQRINIACPRSVLKDALIRFKQIL